MINNKSLFEFDIIPAYTILAFIFERAILMVTGKISAVIAKATLFADRF
jgi:hypothetical protein